MDINSKIDQAKGQAEQKIGEATNDDEMQAQGERHETGGKLKEKISDARDGLNSAVDKMQDKLDHNDDK